MVERMADRKRILITGAAGKVGSALRRYLRDRYDFRLLFHRNVPEVEAGDQVVVSDLSNLENMIEIGEGMHAIVHLGIAVSGHGAPRTLYNQMIFEANIRGTYNIFESARINGVPKVVFASTNHVTGFYERGGCRLPPRAAGAAGQHVRRQQGLRRGPRTLLLRRVRQSPATTSASPTFPRPTR